MRGFGGRRKEKARDGGGFGHASPLVHSGLGGYLQLLLCGASGALQMFSNCWYVLSAVL